MSKPKEFSYMTKDKLMTYTFIALLILAVLSYISFGITSLIAAAIAVLVAVGIDVLLYKVAADSPLNIMSAAVFGLIVALSYSLGVPGMTSASPDAFILPLEAPDAYLYLAAISAVGMVIFKKLQGLAGRKFVNPAAAAKLVVMLPFLNTVLLAKEHLVTGPLLVPSLAGPIGYDVIGGNGAASFASYIQACFANPTATEYSPVEQLMLVQKWHGWVGGISSIAVIIVGVALFVICRRYIKWRITLTYLATVAVMAALLTAVYGGDMLLRIEFELFIGSSIFLAFFMATDPATTPLTYAGQGIFGVGLGVLTVLIQTYTGFFGGSILALIIMNLTSPKLDKIGKLKPTTETKEPKLPKAKQFEKVKPYECIRCGACMRVCCHKLSPILIKQAFDKQDVNMMSKLNADYCTGCGHCTFVCPARIDLRASILRAKAMLRNQ
jgi:electron transport complex protein RnfD